MEHKREQYFTMENISEITESMLAAIPARGHLPDFHPDEAALLVLDMQRYFLESDSHAFIPSAEAILPRICSIMKAFLALQRPVYLTRHLNNSENASMMSTWWRSLISENEPKSEIIAELANYQAPVIEKSQYDAFYDTNLLQLLRNDGISQVVITGVMTNLCCETTARSAFIRGFQVFFPVDGTATCNRQLHRASLLNLSHGFATITKIEALAGKLKA